ncbi:amidohydrolase family protein [Flagellimonas sp. GZD32]|uniref:amidohydrolase family protein n=1 Tax=Flagellimonas cixiensis TaxID=3228750 RepID=UPI0035C91776
MCTLLVNAQDGVKPIFDVHLHGYVERSYRPVPGAPESYEKFKTEMQAQLKKYNIVGAVKSGGMYDDAFEKKMLQGYETNKIPNIDTTEFRRRIKNGELEVWGEMMPLFNGQTLADPEYAPYLAICESEGIPIGLHTGSGPPGISKQYKKYSLALGDPLLIEEVLINYPKLKIYLMHSGGQFYRNALALMEKYPQVYSGLGTYLWLENGPSSQYAEEFLRGVKKGGMVDRVMYGSDAMYWPGNLEKSIQKLDSFDFLTEEDKRKIFYENAVTFFELEKSNN